MNATVSINLRLVEPESATVSVFDHGFLYGEGVYETLRTYQRRPFLFERHVARFRRSAELIDLPIPVSDDELRQSVDETIAAQPPNGEVYVRILLTRGVGELTYRTSATPHPTLVVLVKPLAPQPARAAEDGVEVALVDVRRNHRDTINPAIKSNNLLNNALAMQQAYTRGADEALMCNLEGSIVECAQSNFFLVVDGTVLTPPLSDGLLPGITRQFVLELASELGLPARETSLRPPDLDRAQEAFLTGTTREIMPIVRVDGRAIGDGRPGPVTARLLGAFRAHTRSV